MNCAAMTFDPQATTDLLAKLVQAQSVNPPGNEIIAAEVLSDWLQQRDIASQIDLVEANRANLIASIGQGSPRILLNSHLDVVDAGDHGRWTHDPFSAHIENGTLYGRGACDAKGCVAAMAGALVALADHPPCQVVLAAVMGEEKSALGSKHLTKQDTAFNAAIVGEPTNLNLSISQKGRIGIFIDLQGSPSHPTRAQIEDNPTFKLAAIMSFLQSFALDVQKNHKGSFVVLEVNAGKPNVLTPPERCSLTLSWWFPSQMNHDEAISQFQEPFKELAAEHNIAHQIRFHRGAGSYSIAKSHRLVKTMEKTVKKITGMSPATGAFPASCDMWVFGQAGIPTIILGPGDLNLAHAINESTDLTQVITATHIYAQAVCDLASDF